MIGYLRTFIRKQPIIALYLSLRLYSSFITSRPGVGSYCYYDFSPTWDPVVVVNVAGITFSPSARCGTYRYYSHIPTEDPVVVVTVTIATVLLKTHLW